MSKKRKKPEDRSWRDINQSVNTRAMTSQGRRRFGWNLVRMFGTTLLIGAACAIGIYLWRGFETPVETLGPVASGEPVRDVVVLTDGVLADAWVLERLALPEGILLMSVDLEAMKAALEMEGQVRAAIVKRDYPDTLVVTLAERMPIVRVMVPLEPGKPEAMLVGRDGFVYRGYHYDPQMVATLPWIDGIRLSREGDGFAPIQGMDRVSDLLLAARQEAPHLASQIRVVSLAEHPLMIVKTRSAEKIIFEGENYRRQFGRLDFILDHYRDAVGPEVRFKRIDVSIEAQVSVQLASATPSESPLLTQHIPTQQ
jgi:cell division protein FtsQ